MFILVFFTHTWTAPPLAQVSVASGSSLLGAASSLPLTYGMLGGMVPVPFQFPSLLSMPLGAGGSASTASGSAAASNTAFSSLAQSE